MIKGALVASIALALGGCGYRVANLAHDDAGPFFVEVGEVRAPDAVIAAEIEAGARAELARLGLLARRGERGSAIVVSLVRVDESPAGVAADHKGSPIARAVRVSVVGRAAIDAGPRATHELVASEVIGADGTAKRLLLREEALRAAARRLGEGLVRQMIGLPEPAPR